MKLISFKHLVPVFSVIICFSLMSFKNRDEISNNFGNAIEIKPTEFHKNIEIHQAYILWQIAAVLQVTGCRWQQAGNQLQAFLEGSPWISIKESDDFEMRLASL